MPSREYYIQKFNECLNENKEIGYVEGVSYPLIFVEGLPGVKTNELVYLEDGSQGIVLGLNSENVEILLLSEDKVSVGERVSRAGKVLQIPVSESYLGMVIDPLGNPVLEDQRGFFVQETRPVDSPAPGINSRSVINAPFFTGVTVVDMLIPQGKGQRSLVLGDRKTGKTSFLLQTMLSQAKNGTVCIYSCVGKKRTDVLKVMSFVKQNNISDKCIVVMSTSVDPLGLIYLSPYSSMTLAEYFRDLGKDVLLIIDDMTSHAKYYREISLLGRRFPGRNSYPGDIFYLHSRLLERAGNFKTRFGVNSITCLPVVDTVEGDISGYIQTNLMSITDGHIFFDKSLFAEGRRPSINYFLSVTRVGRQTQSQLRWGANRELYSFLTLYEKMLGFVHFGAELNEGVKSTLSTGKNILAFLDQASDRVIQFEIQLLLFSLIWVGIIVVDDENKFKFMVDKACEYYENNNAFKSSVDNIINQAKDFNMLLGLVSARSKEFSSYLSTESYLPKFEAIKKK